jgi:hypothetical protein
MRKVGAWRTTLQNSLNTQTQGYGTFSMQVPELLDIELVLTTMRNVFPGQNPARAWAVLNGQQLPHLKELSPEQQKAIVLTRLHLPNPLGRRAWERKLHVYTSLPSHYALYSIENEEILEHENALLFQERKEALRKAVEVPPEWVTQESFYAPPGRYGFTIQQDSYEVGLPEWTETLSRQASCHMGEKRTPDQHPLTISFQNLQEEADWMDRIIANEAHEAQSWGWRIRRLQFRLVSQAGVQPSTHLTLDGLLHLIGMVGSGKSSFFTVLTVYLARRGYRVMMVLSDVASIFRELENLEMIRHADPHMLQAVPLLGRSSRMQHLNRLYRSLAVRDGVSLSYRHPAYQYLSTICALDGLRQDERSFLSGSEPCTRLIALEGEHENKRFDCPFLPTCPVHQVTHTLPTANIWLATPASLLASSPQSPLFPYDMRYIDLAMRHMHVMLVDEADLVQVQFDDRFAPMEVLVGVRGESWLDRMAIQVARQFYRPGRPLIGSKPDLDRWQNAHDNTQHAVNRLYSLLRHPKPTTREWLGSEYFSHDILISKFMYEFKTYSRHQKEVARQAQLFKYQPLISLVKTEKEETPPPSEWYTALHLEMLKADTDQAVDILEKWLDQVCTPKFAAASVQERNQLALHLLVMLLVITLDHALQEMIMLWPATEILGVDRGRGGFFYRPSEDQLRLLPEPPMGGVMGFQYYSTDKTGRQGELRFFQVKGLGRDLLYHLHDALKISDGICGPHVILTSGTSWAPGSWKYHIPVPPGAVLLPQETGERETPAQRITCHFHPLLDPSVPGKFLHVSGHSDPERRIRSLREMVEALARPQGFQASFFETELNALEPHRRRILLVVGSYREAKEVGDVLASLFMEHAHFSPEDVLTLVSDREGDGNDEWENPPGTLVRSLLNHMPKLPSKFLIAPLQAIERGHNILIGQEAALGSVFFLVRPYPVPGEIHAAINKLNAWVYPFLSQIKGLSATLAGSHLRQQAAEMWSKMLTDEKTYKDLEEERSALLWTQFVLVWQCIGRLLRGGASARVHFVDAKWAEQSADGNNDTEQTSMLVGFRRILNEAVTDPDPLKQAIAHILYGEAQVAFNNVERVHYA